MSILKWATTINSCNNNYITTSNSRALSDTLYERSNLYYHSTAESFQQNSLTIKLMYKISYIWALNLIVKVKLP